jgi:hypothetical protein
MPGTFLNFISYSHKGLQRCGFSPRFLTWETESSNFFKFMQVACGGIGMKATGLCGPHCHVCMLSTTSEVLRFFPLKL